MASAVQELWVRTTAGSGSHSAGEHNNSSATQGGNHGGHGMTPAELQAFRHWMSEVNADMMKWYGLSLGLLVCLFIGFHLSRTFMHLQGRRGMMARVVVAPFRVFRSIAIRKLPRFTSTGHFALIAVYTGLNVFFAVYKTGFGGKYGLGFISKRCGWLALVNLGMVFLLAMKNNPIAFISGYSHERLNVLHRWAGRFVWVQASIHVCLYIYTWASTKSFISRLAQEDPTFRAGFVAWLFFSILFFCSFEFIRRRAYEYFYIIHIVCALGAVAALGFHEPKTYGMVLYLVGSMWIFDRLVRFFRGVHYSKGTKATIYPLPGDAIKVVLYKNATFQPASHGFLSIPSLKLFQSHPFTISSADSLEFIIRGQRGFTRKLYDRALKNPGESLPCYFDGPYGNVPDYRRMNRVILFAGGSGGSFSFSIATDIARHLNSEAKSNSIQRRQSSLEEHFFEYGRPDLTSIVKEAVKNAGQNDLIAVGACGPTELMRCARNATAGVIKTGGPSISLHCEQFGWG
ncbi:hypothetical protein ABW21_db0203726 [Orbilia brochopaga]|nr:hypothetical protein ABW21_db0203726 [Drechslerella brochopaga]